MSINRRLMTILYAAGILMLLIGILSWMTLAALHSSTAEVYRNVITSTEGRQALERAEFWISVFGWVVFMGLALGIVIFGAVLRALSVFRTNAVELRDARIRAEDAVHAKAQFLATMSHEIRTPMNGVMSMAELLEQTDLNSEQKDLVVVVKESASALLTVINDILDFSKIEAGKLRLESVPFSLSDVTYGIGDLLAGRADEKALTFTVEVDVSLPDRLVGDPTRLRQILLNLASNAIKFTEQGEVALRVRAAAPFAPGDAGIKLRVDVADTGIGLAEEHRDLLFKPFSQVDSSTSRHYGGSGLGLSISRRLTEMMGGRIGVEGELRRGSTFWVELPFGVAEPMRPTPAVVIADAHVLAAGFTEWQRAALERYLAGAGITQARYFANADDLRRELPLTIARGVIPVVLLSHALADGGGLTLGRELVAGPHGTMARVVLAAPRGMNSTLTEADRIGLFATLTLPLRYERLWLVLAAALGRIALGDRRTTGDAGGPGYEPPPADVARNAGALILVAEDNPINQTVIHKLLYRNGYAHEMTANGHEALARYRAGRYGFVLTDFHMPDMDGFELTARIRADEAERGGTERIPIVALTADVIAGIEDDCRRAGMDGYLTKPINTEELFGTLDRFLPQAKALRRKAGVKAGAPTVGPATDTAVLNLDRLREAFGDINAEARQTLKGFLEDLPGLAEQLAGAIFARDADRARACAHALKGTALSVGAVRLGNFAGELQSLLDRGAVDEAMRIYPGLSAAIAELRSAASVLQ